MILVKRAYDPTDPSDGGRFLVDRLWPRGVAKQQLQLDGWLKELAPSDELRHWFGHDPVKWDEFRHRYHAELDAKRPVVRQLLSAARRGNVTLVYGARDADHNNAVALREYLQGARSGRRPATHRSRRVH